MRLIFALLLALGISGVVSISSLHASSPPSGCEKCELTEALASFGGESGDGFDCTDGHFSGIVKCENRPFHTGCDVIDDRDCTWLEEMDEFAVSADGSVLQLLASRTETSATGELTLACNGAIASRHPSRSGVEAIVGSSSALVF